MKKSFERGLKQYRDIAEDELSGDLSGEELEAVLGWHKKKAVERDETGEEKESEIYEIQKKKQELMAELHGQLRCLDDEGCELEREPDSRFVTYDEENDMYTATREDGTQEHVTYGELLTDGEWGIHYHFDGNTIPRGVIKKYLVEAAKRHLRHYLDSQITASELGTKGLLKKERIAYSTLGEISSGRKEMAGGHIAEILVKNVLKKLAYDYGVGMEVIDADIYEDVHRKIDFIIKRHIKKRGVGIEVSEVEEIGVQFTLQAEAARGRSKRRSFDKAMKEVKEEDDLNVKDIILVAYPMSDVKLLWELWKKEHTSGGPDSLLEVEEVGELFAKLLEGMDDINELEKEWKGVEDRKEEYGHRRGLRFSNIFNSEQGFIKKNYALFHPMTRSLVDAMEAGGLDLDDAQLLGVLLDLFKLGQQVDVSKLKTSGRRLGLVRTMRRHAEELPYEALGLLEEMRKRPGNWGTLPGIKGELFRKIATSMPFANEFKSPHEEPIQEERLFVPKPQKGGRSLKKTKALLWHHREDLPERLREILDSYHRGGSFGPVLQSEFDRLWLGWFEDMFGSKYVLWSKNPENRLRDLVKTRFDTEKAA